MTADTILISGAREHNLKDLTVELPRNALVVLTGLSGSGKSSLAFDTIYAEGQRRYVESLSAYARQFLGQMDKPDVDFIEGLSPAISIDQKTASRNPRSTVGTVTEVYDYLRLLYARIGVPHCPNDGEVVKRQTPQQIVDRILELDEGTRFMVLAPVVEGRKGEYQSLFKDLVRQGYSRARVDGEVLPLDEDIRLDRYYQHTIEVVVDRLVRSEGMEERLTQSIETALGLAEGKAMVDVIDGPTLTFSQHLACDRCGLSFSELAPRNFSFNSPYGACPTCAGIGARYQVADDLVVPNDRLSVAGGAIAPWTYQYSGYYSRLLNALAEDIGFSLDTPWRELPEAVRTEVLHGNHRRRLRVSYRNRRGRRRIWTTRYEGVIPHLERRHRNTGSDSARDSYRQYMRQVPCDDCDGARLGEISRAVTVAGHNIHSLTQLSLGGVLDFIERMELTDREAAIAERVLKEIRSRVSFLLDVGLGYLTLGRSAATLAGGEAQRIRLATQIGSGLVGVLYILDEPSIGLHQRDNRRLIETLIRLRDLGNTVVVVEHDEETIRSADHVVDIGPGAGEHGGRIVAQGPVDAICEERSSITGDYLSGRRLVPVPPVRREGNGKVIRVLGAAEHNLDGIDVEFPLGKLVCVTGVSGSGKSTLVEEILYKALLRVIYRSRVLPGRHRDIEGIEHIDKVINIDQSPIGRTPRSNPATYTKLFDYIRSLYTKVPESQARGYKPGRFSFNVAGGRCEECRGDGTIKIEMHFLPDVYVPCEQCRGRRYNRETLQILWKGRSVADVLEMSVADALELFAHHPRIALTLQTLNDVGLGYIRLGQAATTLSGGEAQRVKLASELRKRSTGRTMYILDEPTTGLHFEDVRRLLGVLHRLVDGGNTVVVIEHNLDVVKSADHLIDLGPEGGSKGGRVVATGTPEEVASSAVSHTGHYLDQILAASAAPVG
ncbi:MAG: excinuclease ABC subunit UvrA [Acidimicrobiia bacterium]|nr:excinuclease ABC subunit UvrA [Acidimicrobiia bacterium]MYB78708.1 excinuclease ABC subunit UvrA [Acidimicrobiia bacterium]MYD41175.1 excinuclease ABC subunit UvrA [Acidimicrobiia bacterium]